MAQAVSLVFGEGHFSGRDVLADAWIDSDADGGPPGADEDGDGDDVDDEPEILGDMLHNFHMAEDALRAARVERNKAVLRACRVGAAVPEDEASALRTKVEAAVKELVRVKEVLVGARRAAKARIEAEAAEERRRREREEVVEKERRAAAEAQAEQERARAESGKRAGAGEGRDDGQDDDDTPCPPPAQVEEGPICHQ